MKQYPYMITYRLQSTGNKNHLNKLMHHINEAKNYLKHQCHLLILVDALLSN